MDPVSPDCVNCGLLYLNSGFCYTYVGYWFVLQCIGFGIYIENKFRNVTAKNQFRLLQFLCVNCYDEDLAYKLLKVGVDEASCNSLVNFDLIEMPLITQPLSQRISVMAISIKK